VIWLKCVITFEMNCANALGKSARIDKTGSGERRYNEPMKREKTNFWHTPEYGDMSLLHATYITHTFAPHFHEGYAIGVIESGAEQYDYRRQHHLAPAGSIVLVNPGEIHTGCAADENGWTYRMTYPGIVLMRQIASEITGKQWDTPLFRETVVSDTEVVANFREMHRAMEASEARLLRDILLRETFAMLITRYADDRPSPLVIGHERQSVQQAREYIHAHYQFDITLDDVADAAALSPFHLTRVFKEETGLPPHKYLTQVRVQRAQDLLQGGLPIVDVAFATGFADQSHLTKWFKRIVGIPPGEYLAG
jgi:AraC-like DNA-binding protein